MKIVVVYGFLGCGKTTFINHMLKNVWNSARVVVLENESGKESVDGDFLRDQDYRVVDLKDGCVCCTLRSELPSAIKQIEEDIAPDTLILEPSGIASLEEIITIPTLRIDSVITLVDVHRYKMLMHINPEYYRRQFMLSPILAITKGDIAEAESVEAIFEELARINPMAKIYHNYKRVDSAEWLNNIDVHCKQFRSFVMRKDGAKLRFPLKSFAVCRPLSRSTIEGLIAELVSLDGFQLVRCKGIVTLDAERFKVDFAGGEVAYTHVSDLLHNEESLTFWWLEEPNEDLCELLTNVVNRYLYE